MKIRNLLSISKYKKENTELKKNTVKPDMKNT